MLLNYAGWWPFYRLGQHVDQCLFHDQRDCMQSQLSVWRGCMNNGSVPISMLDSSATATRPCVWWNGRQLNNNSTTTTCEKNKERQTATSVCACRNVGERCGVSVLFCINYQQFSLQGYKLEMCLSLTIQSIDVFCYYSIHTNTSCLAKITCHNSI